MGDLDQIKKEFKVVNKNIANVDEDVNRIDRDMTSDRQSFDSILLKLDSVDKKLDNVLNTLTRFQTKTKDAVKDAVAETTEPLREQVGQFVDKKVIRVKVPTDKWTGKVLSLISRWKRGDKNGK
jgi:septation ring formation regulator EzrA